MDAAELPEILEKYRALPFEWGTMDCCIFAANVVRDLTGVDVAEDLRGTYNTKFGAAKVILPYGDLQGLLVERFGVPRPAVLARRGDFVLGPVPEPALGVCTGNRAVFKSDGGLVALPLARCYRSWKCPAQSHLQ